jgi:uncharacterized protein
MKFGLPETFQVCLAEFGKTNSRVEQIILFGSRSTFKYRPGSDVDLALKGKLLSTEDIIDLESLLSKLDILNTFDILLYDQLQSAELIENINGGIILYSKATAIQPVRY